MYPYIIIAWNLLESLRCLTLSAMVRISCTRQDLLSRLLRDDSPPLLGDLEATGPRPWARFNYASNLHVRAMRIIIANY